MKNNISQVGVLFFSLALSLLLIQPVLAVDINWTEQPIDPANASDYSAFASDSDGTNLITAISYGRLFTSADSGVTWTERQPAGAADKGWRVGGGGF